MMLTACSRDEKGGAPVWIGLALVFVMTAAPVGAADRLAEARAAVHLGYQAANRTLAEDATRPSAIEMLDELARQGGLAPGDEYRAADLRLRALDAMGAWSEAETFLNSLPPQFAGLDATRTGNLIQIWILRHQAAIENWAAVEAGLASLYLEEGLPPAALLDADLLRARLQVRTPGSGEDGYRALAGLVAAIPGRGIAPEDVDPYLARQDLIEIEYLGNWGLTKEILGILAKSAPTNAIARRRWLEVACPSLHPAMPVFREIGREDLIELDAERNRLAQFVQVKGRPAGGLASVLQCQLEIEELYAAGRREELPGYVANLPDSVPGVEEPVWIAHRMAWETLALGVNFQWPKILANADARSAAILNLPRQQNLLPLACLTAAYTRTLEPKGLDFIAEYLSTGSPDPKFLRLAFEEAAIKVSDADARAFHERLAGYPNSAAAMALRSVYGETHKTAIRNDNPGAVSEASLKDAALALDLADGRSSPMGLGLRELMASAAGSAAEAVHGEQGREDLAVNWSKTTDAIPALSKYSRAGQNLQRRVAGSGRNAAISPQLSFAELNYLVSEDGAGVAGTVLRRQPPAVLGELLAEIPEVFHTNREVFATRALLDELARRDEGSRRIASNDLQMIRLRHAEALLSDPSRFEEGVAALRSIASGSDRSTDPVNVRRANSILGALDGVPSQEAYWWGIQQMLMAWEFRVSAVESLAVRLASSLEKFQQAGMVPASPPESYVHPLQIARALYHAGDYANSARVYSLVLRDPALTPSSEPYWIAESWRILAWERLAMANDTRHTEAGKKMLQEIIGYIRSRAPEISDPEDRGWMERHGLWAAEQLEDDSAIRFFGSVVGTQPPAE